jgi:hypothetical protein
MNTGEPARDLEPTQRPSRSRTPWVLHLGYDLETICSHYAELQVIVTYGLPDAEARRLRDLGGWALGHLRELGITGDLIESFEEALAGLTRQEDFRRAAPDTGWADYRVQMSHSLEQLITAVRDAIGERCRRYYDYGVMLHRIQLCAALVRIAPELPVAVADLLPNLVPLYRKELSRVTELFQMLVTDNSPNRPRDPEQYILDYRFDIFSRYLATWRTSDAEPDDDFFQQLEDVTHSAGFFRISGRFTQDVIWARQPEMPAQHERMPLQVPHTHEDRETLQRFWDEARAIAQGGDSDRYLTLMRYLLEMCRYRLGPVHPLTLHVHLSYAMAHIMTGEAPTGFLMTCDIADTAWHYYGSSHPAAYLINGDAYGLLKLVAPDTAQQLYDSRLKYLVETDETDLPSPMHAARRTLRKALDMNGQDTDRHPD